MGKRKKKINGGFVILEYGLLDSEEWKTLSPSSVKAYFFLRRKFNGSNADDLSLTYQEMKPYMAANTLNRAFKELVGKQIISIVRPGGLFARCSIYSIKSRWFKQG